ncbi:MAG: sugar phosphate isomerase/epimerase family protein [Candidatus Ratteibacteria bacterium]
MKASITIYSCSKMFANKEMTVQSFIEYAAKTGFQGVDLGYYWKNKEEEMAQTKSWLKDYGVALSGYIVGNNFGAVVGTEKVGEELQKVKTAIDDAAQLEAKVLRIFAGGREGLSWDEGKDLICDCFSECTEYAAGKGVVLALEDHGGLAATSSQMLYYIEKIDSPFFKANVDIGNFWNYGELPVDGVSATAPYAAMVHVKDLKQQPDGSLKSVPVGDGDIDFSRCFRIIRDAGYDGFVSLEYEAGVEPYEGISRSLAHIVKSLPV